MKRQKIISAFLSLLFAVAPLCALTAEAEPVTFDSVTIVAFGDSIAYAGKWETAFEARSGLSVINKGVSGNNTDEALARFDSDVAACDPDVVFIAFGTNDSAADTSKYVLLANYKENLRTIIDRVRAVGATPIIVTPPPVDDDQYLTRHYESYFTSFGGPNGFVNIYVNAARDVAKEKKVAVADVNEKFWNYDFDDYLSDGVHPTDAGYGIYAEVALEAYYKATVADLNIDGRTGTLDYIMLKRAVLGTYSLSAVQNKRADVNGDGDITAADYLIVKRDVIGTYEIDRGIDPPLYPDYSAYDTGLVVTADLTAGSTRSDVMSANTNELQNKIDYVSNAGGGIVLLPAGMFYFSSQGWTANGYEEVCVYPRDNVTVIGAGTKTILKPVGETWHGLDMFYYNQYSDSGFTDPDFLDNSNFLYLVVDGELAHSEEYSTAGKGFMINLFSNCIYDHVVVKNTDGTGFGMDCPINCTIVDCIALNNGKAATTSSAGASGFGIGVGYTSEESILIDRCYSEGNKKFGVFFEHQGRFNAPKYTAQSLENILVTNCVAKDNFIDFGGELALDVTYRNCTVPADSTSSAPLTFRHHSIRCHFEDMHVLAEFTDVPSTHWAYEYVRWAVNKGITNGTGSNQFSPTADCTKGSALTFIYRMADMPGTLKLTRDSENPWYEDVLEWAIAAGITSNSDDMNAACSRADFTTYLWKFAGCPAPAADPVYAYESYYDDATKWAMSIGIMNTYSTANINRATAVTLLKRYYDMFIA